MRNARRGARGFEQDAVARVTASGNAAPRRTPGTPGNDGSSPMPGEEPQFFPIGRVRFGTPGTAEDRRRRGRQAILDAMGVRLRKR